MRCRGLRPGLTGAVDEVFVGGEFGKGHRAAGVEFLGGDADFGPETELGTVREGCGDIGIDTGSIHFFPEQVYGLRVFADYALAVAGTVSGYVGEGLSERVHGFDAHLIVQKFCPV